MINLIVGFLLFFFSILREIQEKSKKTDYLLIIIGESPFKWY